MSSHELGFFLTKNENKMPNKQIRTNKSLVHKIRLHGRRGKGTAEFFSRKIEASTAERRWRNPVWPSSCVVVVVVVVDSHIQRIVLATEETTVTQQVSHRPIKCQSRLWSQRGTKVNGSHHGDNPLLRPKGSKSRQKVMRLYKQWHRPISKRFIKPPYSISRATSIDSECCRLPTTNVLSKKPEKLRKNYAPTSFDQQVQDSQGHTLYRNKKK